MSKAAMPQVRLTHHAPLDGHSIQNCRKLGRRFVSRLGLQTFIRAAAALSQIRAACPAPSKTTDAPAEAGAPISTSAGQYSATGLMIICTVPRIRA